VEVHIRAQESNEPAHDKCYFAVCTYDDYHYVLLRFSGRRAQ